MRTVFCGREAELANLRAAFERIKAGGKPELVVITGEAGLGKTRLIQEFFNWLSTHHDGVDEAGYWPDVLDQRDNNLLVNPAPGKCLPQHELPFLWWGLRIADPGKANALTLGAVRGHLDFLRPHLEPMYRARRVAERKKGTATTVTNAVVDTALNLSGVNVVWQIGKTVFETALKLGGVGKEHLADQQPTDMRALEQRERKSLNEELLSDLGLLLGKAEGEKLIPAVIFFDDGQFSPFDPGATAFLSELIDRAWAAGWPLLVIVTYWQSEWRQQIDHGGDSMARAIAARSQKLGDDWQPLSLGPVSDLAPSLIKILPGLLPEQSRAILERAGGNPRYLEQMALLARGRARYFQAHSPEGAMTPEGFREFWSKTVAIQDVVEQRIKDAPAEVRTALALSSLQGVKFLNALTVETAIALHIANAELGLRQAELPLNFIKTVDIGLAEFTQRIFHEVASAILPDLLEIEGPEIARLALKAALKRRLEEASVWDSLPPAAQEHSLLAAANLFESSPEDDERVIASRALIGLLQHSLDRFDYLDAGDLAERLWGGVSEGKWSAEDLGASGLWAVYDALNTIGLFCEAEDAATARLHLVETARREHDTSDNQRAVAAALMHLSDLNIKLDGPGDKARAYLNQAITIFDQLGETTHASEFQRDLTITIQKLADIDLAEGKRDDARKAFERSLAIRETLAKAHPNVPQFQRDLTITIQKLADIDLAEGKRDDARKAFERSLAIRETLAKAHPNVPQFQRDLTITIERLADIDLAEGKRDDARKAFERSLAISETLAKAHPNVPEFQRDLTVTKCALAGIGICEGDLGAAISLYEKVLGTMRVLAKSSRDVLIYEIDVAEYVWWLSVLEAAQQSPSKDPVRTALRDMVLLERGKEIDSLPRRIELLRDITGQAKISQERRAELTKLRTSLRDLDAEERLDEHGKGWLSLVEALLAAPAPTPSSSRSSWFWKRRRA